MTPKQIDAALRLIDAELARLAKLNPIERANLDQVLAGANALRLNDLLARR
jgi:hypothetical protein